MPSNDSRSSPSPKRRKARPSRGRGLRTTAGCLTCRKRRLKCKEFSMLTGVTDATDAVPGDEAKPGCGQCTKSLRECVYAQEQRTSLSPSTSQPVATSPPDSSGALKLSELLQNATPGPAPSEIGSPVTTATSFSHGNAPHYWYDLIAEDAVKNIDNYNFLTTSGARWSFEPRLAVRLSEQADAPVERHVPSLHHSPKASFDQGSIQAITATSGPSYVRLSFSQLPLMFLSPHSDLPTVRILDRIY